MSSLANTLARRLWGGLLWLVRRRWMRDLLRFSFRFVPAHRRAKFLRDHYRQNRIARRYGLRALRVVIFLFLTYIVIIAFAYLAIFLMDSGILVQPQLEH